MGKIDYDELLFNPTLISKREKTKKHGNDKRKSMDNKENRVEEICLHETKRFLKRLTSDRKDLVSKIEDFVPFLHKGFQYAIEQYDTFKPKEIPEDFQKNVTG